MTKRIPIIFLLILFFSCQTGNTPVTAERQISEEPSMKADGTQTGFAQLKRIFPTDPEQTIGWPQQEFFQTMKQGQGRRIASFSTTDSETGSILIQADYTYEEDRVRSIAGLWQGQEVSDRFTYNDDNSLYRYVREERRYYNAKTLSYNDETDTYEFENITGKAEPEARIYPYIPDGYLEIFETYNYQPGQPTLIQQRNQYLYKNSKLYFFTNFLLKKKDNLFPFSTITEISQSRKDNIIRITFGYREQEIICYQVYFSYNRRNQLIRSESYNNGELMTFAEFVYNNDGYPESIAVFDGRGKQISSSEIQWEEGRSNLIYLWF